MLGIIRPNRPQLICKGKKAIFQWKCLMFRPGKLVRMIVDVWWRRRRCGLVSTEILSHVFIWGVTEKSSGALTGTESIAFFPLLIPPLGAVLSRFYGSAPSPPAPSPAPQRLSVHPRLHPFAADMATARRRPATQRCLLIGAEETAAPRLQEDHCSLSSAQRSSCPDRTCARARARSCFQGFNKIQLLSNHLT